MNFHWRNLLIEKDPATGAAHHHLADEGYRTPPQRNRELAAASETPRRSPLCGWDSRRRQDFGGRTLPCDWPLSE